MKIESLFGARSVELLDYLIQDRAAVRMVAALKDVYEHAELTGAYGRPVIFASRPKITGQIAMILVVDYHENIPVVDETEKRVSYLDTNRLNDIFENLQNHMDILTKGPLLVDRETFIQRLDEDDTFNDCLDEFFSGAVNLINETSLTYGMKYGKYTPMVAKKMLKQYWIKMFCDSAFDAGEKSEGEYDEA